MGMARLNVWITATDDPCAIDNRTWFVNIYDCHGKILEWCGRKFGVLRAPCGHLDIEIPPGCYRVNAVWSFRTEGGAYYGNHFTDNAVICACCDEHVCVKLFNPSIHRCGIIFTRAVQDLIAQKALTPEMGGRTAAVINEVLAAATKIHPAPTAQDVTAAGLDEMEKLVRAQQA